MAKSKSGDKLAVKSSRGRVWDPRLLKQTQLAGLVGVSGPAITKWGKRGCPRNEDKSYDLAAVVKWLREGSCDVSRVPQSEVIRILGVSKPTMGEWGKRGCPRNRDKSYDLAAVWQWRMAELEERIRLARRLSMLEKGRARKMDADAELAEMSVAQRKGELLPRAGVIAGWVARYKGVQTRLLGMLGRLGSRGVSNEHVGLVREEVLDAMKDLAAGQVALQLSPKVAAGLAKLLGLDEAPVAAATRTDEGEAS